MGYDIYTKQFVAYTTLSAFLIKEIHMFSFSASQEQKRKICWTAFIIFPLFSYQIQCSKHFSYARDIYSDERNWKKIVLV